MERNMCAGPLQPPRGHRHLRHGHGHGHPQGQSRTLLLHILPQQRAGEQVVQ
jgi:hypothetical protein